MPSNPQLSVLAKLELPVVLRLTNDPILHSSYWPLVPTKIPGDCQKFKGKSEEEPQVFFQLLDQRFHSIEYFLGNPNGRCFQNGTLTYLKVPLKIPIPCLCISSLTFTYQFDMKLGPIS